MCTLLVYEDLGLAEDGGLPVDTLVEVASLSASFLLDGGPRTDERRSFPAKNAQGDNNIHCFSSC